MVNEMYQITKDFPKEESYGLTSQIKRSAVSVPSNIAEGAARQSNKEYIQLLYIALGSLMELDTQLVIAKNINGVDEKMSSNIDDKIETIGKMFNGVMTYRKSKVRN